MDRDRFDGIARALAAGASRRGAVLAALGALAGGAALTTETAAKRRKKRCTPACASGQTCVKGACACDNGGTVCGAACCLIGQRCEGVTCVDLPEPGSCIAYGEPCKNAGRRCCENLQCGSGQGGQDDVACWVRKTGRCTSSAECIYGTACVDGICVAPVPTPVPTEPPCTPSIPVTGEPTVDGAALGAAIAAATGTSTVISLGTGDYQPINTIIWDQVGKSVTVRACPGAEAVISNRQGGNTFTVKNGTMTLQGPGLAIRGYAVYSYAAYAEGGRLVLDNVDIDGNYVGVYVKGGTVEINGGSIVAGTLADSRAITFAKPSTGRSTLTCSPNPSVTGQCVCESATLPSGSGDGSCPVSECCAWCREDIVAFNPVVICPWSQL